jgi:hypothetical protein
VRVEAILWSTALVFYLIAGAAYWYLSGDPVGVTALLVASLFGAVGAANAWLWRRRVGDRAEDRADALIEDYAGQVGYFPASSAWPLPIAAGISLVALGVLFGLWTAVPGLSLLALGSARLLDESMHKG